MIRNKHLHVLNHTCRLRIAEFRFNPKIQLKIISENHVFCIDHHDFHSRIQQATLKPSPFQWPVQVIWTIPWGLPESVETPAALRHFSSPATAAVHASSAPGRGLRGLRGLRWTWAGRAGDSDSEVPRCSASHGTPGAPSTNDGLDLKMLG